MFEFAEGPLAEQLGIHRDRIRDARSSLTEGHDWAKCGRVVKYSSDGLEALARALGLDGVSEIKKRAHGATESAGEEKTRATGTVKRLTLNKHIVMAEIGGELCRLKVKDASRFRPRMTVEAVHIKDDLWKFVGRLPRQQSIQRIFAA